MAAELEPPPLGDAEQSDFREMEEGEDLFVSTVTTLESSPTSPLELVSEPPEDLAFAPSRDPVNETLSEVLLEPASNTLSEVGSNPLVEADSNPLIEVDTNPLIEVDSNPLIEVDNNPLIKAASNPLFDDDDDPLFESASNAFIEPASNPLFEVDSDPVVDAAKSNPLFEVDSKPLAEPASKPISEVPSNPLSEPPSKPTSDLPSEVIAKPVSEPASLPASLPVEEVRVNSNGPKTQEVILDDDPEDLFAEATEEVSLDSPEREPLLSDGPSPAITPVTPTIMITPRLEPAMFDRTPEEEEEEAGGDTFDMHISVSDPEKVGDGMNAYMAYKVTTKTSLRMFNRSEFSVKRRFSDFLGLHSKLASKYLHVGYIVPPAPEKSIVGMTKVKVGKEDSSSTEFVEKRRSALERYLMRTVKHPILRKDPDVQQFLESTELPRAVSTQALSGAGLLRMVNKAAEAVNKMTIKMNESDVWFEEKQQQFESLDAQLRKLHASVESLVLHRKELSINTASFAKSAAMLGNSEDHTALSRALSQLAEVEEKIDLLHQDQANADFYLFSELVGDYVRLLTAVKGVFDQRAKTWSKWQDAQVMLQRKREAEAKLQFANKPDKLQQAKDEIKEWEGKVEQGEKDFEQISKTIRKEVGRFEKERVKDFKVVIIKYLESLVVSQQQLIKYWEAFLPEAKAIA